ncbi:ribonuclease E [Actinomycetota bacterium]|nr:ribonuclease E [Actinomycetota bacterium]
MTLDSTSASSTDNSTAPEQAADAGNGPASATTPVRRRRATKAAAAPGTDAPTGSTGSAPTSTTDEPAQKPARTRATRARKAVPPVEAADAPAAETAPAPAAEPTDATADAAAPTRPARRRATRTVAAPVAADADGTADGPAASAGTATTPEPAAAAAAEPASTKTAGRRRVTRAQTTLDTADAVQPVAPAAVEPTEEPAAPKRATRTRAKSRTAATDETAAVAPAPTSTGAAAPGTLDVFAELAAAAPTSGRGSGRGSARRGSTRGASADVAAEAPTTSPVTAPAAAQATSQDSGRGAGDQRADDQPRGGSPRLATTALLFQAPDPTARPRRRRAVAPTGSPELISEAAAQLRDADQAVAEVAETVDATVDVTVDAAAPERTAPGRTSRRRGRRGGGRDEEQAEVVLVEEIEEVDDELDPDAELVEGEELVDGEPVEDAAVEDDEPADDDQSSPRRRRRRGGRGRRSRVAGDGPDDADQPIDEDTDEPGEPQDATAQDEDDEDGPAEGEEQGGSSSRRRRRRRRSGRGGDSGGGESEPATVARSARAGRPQSDEVTALRGSTRLEAKRQRRREGRDQGRRRQIITESEFLARRESVERTMVVREAHGRTQIAVLEDGVLVEHYVSRQAQLSMAGNVYLGRVQNVLPSMEAAFVDVGKGRNAVLYAGEVNWDAAGLDGQPRRIEQALRSGDSVLVQVTKDPIGHKGARLTSQVTLAGRYLVYVPGGGMTGISRKLPENERARLKKILREIVPDSAGVIVRTAAEGASEDELRADIVRLQGQWEAIEKKAKSASAPALLQGEPDLAIRVVRDIFNDDFSSLVVEGDEAWDTISGYIGELAPDLAQKVTRWTGQGDVFAAHRVDEQLAKGMDRKVWLPSGGSLVIDRTEAMTVVDVNTGKFTGVGGTLEETVTRNNLEAAEEIVRQLRLRDIGGIIVIDFIDMVLESNRDLVLRRLVEALGRDRTKHQVAEVTSLGLVQMTRKRVGQGLVEAFSETCEHCNGRGFIVHTDPVERNGRPEVGAPQPSLVEGDAKRARRKRGGKDAAPAAPQHPVVPVLPEAREAVKATLATIAAAAAHAHEHGDSPKGELDGAGAEPVPTGAPVPDVEVAHETPAAPVAEAAAEPEGRAPSAVRAEAVVSELIAREPILAEGTGPARDVAAELSGLVMPSASQGRTSRRRGRVTMAAGAPGASAVNVTPAEQAPVEASPAEPDAHADADAGEAPALELTAVDPSLFELGDDADDAAGTEQD